MPGWLVALLPVLSALLGVIVANQASAQRDVVSRLWEQRTNTYIEIMNWDFLIGREVILAQLGVSRELSSQEIERFRMSDELMVRLLAFASDSVRYGYETCNTALFALGPMPSSLEVEMPRDDARRMLERALVDLADVIRKELSSGKLRVPAHLRRRLQRYVAFPD